MAPERQWADAYLAQGRADLEGARLVGATEPSVFAMLMQMVFEKLAKAALLRSGAIALSYAETSHRAASRMVQVMRLQRGILSPIGGPNVWLDALNVVETLENVHPSVTRNGARLEYPWEASNGIVQWPARDLPIVQSLGNPSSNLALRVLQFATLLSMRFDQVFP